MSHTIPFEPLLTRQHLFIILTTSLIAGVVFFDFAIFWYLSDELGHVFFQTPDHQHDPWITDLHLLSFMLMSHATLPIGALLIGRYGDRHGRKPALYLSLLIMALCTILVALLPSQAQIGHTATILFILARLGQGFAAGGVIPSAWVFLTEHLPTKRLGIGCGIVMASCILNTIVLGIIIIAIDRTFTQAQILDYGWKIVFVVGGGLDLLALGTVFFNKETPIFLGNQQFQHQQVNTLNTISLSDHQLHTPNTVGKQNHLIFICQDVIAWVQVLKKGWLPSFLPALVLSTIVASLAIIMTFSLPYIFEFGFQVSRVAARFSGLVAMIFMILGCVFFGFLVDIGNAGRVLIVASILLTIQASILFLNLHTGDELMLALCALTGFLAGLIGAIPAIIVRLFPTRIRLTSTAVIFSLAYALFGGILPVVLGRIIDTLPALPMLFIILVGLVSAFISFYIYYIPRTESDLLR